jgi:hypothetical protein
LLDAVLLLKLGLAPALIIAASLAGNRWGHTVGGWIVGLPLTSAPVILILALEQGGEFAASSAQGSLMGIVSLSAFSLTFSLLALGAGRGWLPPMVAGWGVFLASSLILEYASWPLLPSFAGVVGWLLLVACLLPRPKTQASPAASTGTDMLIRVVAAESLIFAVTEFAPSLGPRLSGLITPFPIYTSVLAASIHMRQGAAQSAEFVRGATVSLFTPAVFWFIVGSTIVAWGVGFAYAIAICASLVLHWLLLKVLRRGPPT